MNIKILESAKNDLINSFHFYNNQHKGLGDYFLTNIYSDIESLRIMGGIHLKVYKNFHRSLSKRFPFGIYYKIVDDVVCIYAVIDFRRDPDWIQEKLKNI